ncbi:MAG: multicopper oxidase domain-containing protein [Methyloglobulus sp.]|nr:multicopper oxidase domain-containing protein [Methyloglobulus sp.]
MQNLEPFLDDLPIPPVVKPFGGIFTAHHLAMKATVRFVNLHQDLPQTKVWCYRLDEGTVVRPGSGRTYLGPTVVVNRGDLVKVRWQNKISEAERLPYEVVKVPYVDGNTPVPQNSPGKNANTLTDQQDTLRAKVRDLRSTLVTHLHGGRSQADSDGWPDDTTTSGQTAYFTYQNEQAATMLWYHDHANHVTRLNVFAGLAGAWLIRDDEEANLDLPDGDFELPLVIQDRNLDLDGAGNFTGALLHKTEVIDLDNDPNPTGPTGGPAEFFGPYTLVNGKIWPKTKVEPRLYRFRVLNGSNARTYRLMLLDDLGNILNNVIYQIGCDQGLMKNKVPVLDTGLILSPGERADLLVDFSSLENRKLYFWNIAEAPFGGVTKAEPTASQIKTEFLQFLENLALLKSNPNQPFFTTTVTADGKSSEVNRRYYPQIMRFDVANSLSGASHIVPTNPLVPVARPNINFTPADKPPIRLMALVEKPAEITKHDGTPNIDGTAMLVFWEYVEITPHASAPPGAEIVRFTFKHPATNLSTEKRYWKAAEEFYDRINWQIHLGDTEQWYIVNVSPDTHPIHVHLVDMKVNQRYKYTLAGTKRPDAPGDAPDFPTGIPDPDNGVPNWEVDGNAHLLEGITATAEQLVDPDQTGSKDTVRINPGEMIGVTIKFSPFCGKYMYHCHILEHEDHDMMRPFVIVPEWIPHHEH